MKIDFSIIIPTYNGEKTIGNLIQTLIAFGKKRSIEIIILDSQSTDATIEIIKSFSKEYAQLHIITVERTGFDHGLTRNIGVQTAKGTFVCFFSQDVLPQTAEMFEYFIEDFRLYPNNVAIFCKQVPYARTPIIQQWEAVRDYEVLDRYVNNGLLVFDLKAPFIPYTRENSFLWFFLSNAAACYKRAFLLQNPLPEAIHGEDILIGKTIITNKLTKIYDNRIVVKHSHTYNYFEYYLRERNEIQFLISRLKLDKKNNIKMKLYKIYKLPGPFYKKIIYVGDLSIYYFIKLTILIEV